VKPGQAIPVAAKLDDAHASISLEWINGESDACARTSGQLLPSGALNAGTRTLNATALEAWKRLHALHNCSKHVAMATIAICASKSSCAAT
jgi:cation transport ATPase